MTDRDSALRIAGVELQDTEHLNLRTDDLLLLWIAHRIHMLMLVYTTLPVLGLECTWCVNIGASIHNWGTCILNPDSGMERGVVTSSSSAIHRSVG